MGTIPMYVAFMLAALLDMFLLLAKMCGPEFVLFMVEALNKPWLVKR